MKDLVLPKGRPLELEESKILITMAMTPEVLLEDCPMEELKNHFLSQVMQKRITVLELPFKITDHFMVMCLTTFLINPAIAVMMLRICFQRHRDYGTELFNLMEWVNIFPDGVPTDKEWTDLWNSPKIPPEERHGSVNKDEN